MGRRERNIGGLREHRRGKPDRRDARYAGGLVRLMVMGALVLPLTGCASCEHQSGRVDIDAAYVVANTPIVRGAFCRKPVSARALLMPLCASSDIESGRWATRELFGVDPRPHRAMLPSPQRTTPNSAPRRVSPLCSTLIPTVLSAEMKFPFPLYRVILMCDYSLRA